MEKAIEANLRASLCPYTHMYMHTHNIYHLHTYQK